MEEGSQSQRSEEMSRWGRPKQPTNRNFHKVITFTFNLVMILVPMLLPVNAGIVFVKL